MITAASAVPVAWQLLSVAQAARAVRNSTSTAAAVVALLQKISTDRPCCAAVPDPGPKKRWPNKSASAAVHQGALISLLQYLQLPLQDIDDVRLPVRPFGCRCYTEPWLLATSAVPCSQFLAFRCIPGRIEHHLAERQTSNNKTATQRNARGSHSSVN